MKCEGVTMFKNYGVRVQRAANKRCGTVLRLGSLFVGPSGIFTVMLHVPSSSSKRKSAQEASQPLVASDVENVSPNAFKEMYTDHQNVAQRKCLLMQVPSLGIRRFEPRQPKFQRQSL